MPPKKQPPSQATVRVESGGSRVSTQASNANKHPGTEAKKTLQVQTRRDPEVIQAEKDKKKAAKEAKEEARRAEAAQREQAQRNLEVYRAHQASSLEHEDDLPVETSPQQQPEAKGKSIMNIYSEFNDTISSAAVTTKGQKRKNAIASSAGDEQLVSGAKKAKTISSSNPSGPNPPQHPAPRRVLKAQPAASASKPASSSVSGVARETTEDQAVPRKRPAEVDVVDEGLLMTPVPRPPSKKVKTNANKPQARLLRRTGLFFHIRLTVGNKMLNKS